MSEFKAVSLVFAAAVILTTVVCAALMTLGAGGELVAVAMIVVGGSGMHLVSRVILRYDSTDRR
ncbi:MAG TPA: hypothetical protein VFR04_07510 [Solirubrobacterales bacterium]|nr:hypothetical protein [Solirubrobacterales bacterium]